MTPTLSSHSITFSRCCCVQALREVENTVGLEGYNALDAGMISYEQKYCCKSSTEALEGLQRLHAGTTEAPAPSAFLADDYRLSRWEARAHSLHFGHHHSQASQNERNTAVSSCSRLCCCCHEAMQRLMSNQMRCRDPHEELSGQLLEM